MADGDPYEIVDPVLTPWAERHGIRITKLYRDDHVRSFWVFSHTGDVRAQVWLDLPDTQGSVTVNSRYELSSSWVQDRCGRVELCVKLRPRLSHP
jgi:hypothetical protein